ncbi:MAG: LysM peptidoglycan-binding domain-containing protein [Bacteroidetes bacterium]|nr:LysM peptidoglycan-binding domain-containing protein [Bacteroidota bacterium]
MKKFSFFVCVLLIQAFCLRAQKGDLMVKSNDNGLYLDHKVAAKETYYSIGRLYNIHPKSIASFNKLDMNRGLNIDQKIRIPLLDTNFTQQGNSGTPVYYRVGENEGLLIVSKKNNNVPLSRLREWNNLGSDVLKKDTRLIIGFLQSKEMKSVPISNTAKTEEVVTRTEDKKDPIPVATEDMTKKEEKKVAEAEEKTEKKEEKKDPPPVVMETRKPSVEGHGYFKNYFEQQVKVAPVLKDETVTSGIFKTTSGWEDGKYYLLIDKVQPGTIVKIINPSNNKAVYAKVLGEMAGIRQNEGYNIRISNAAAASLEITEQDKFIVKVNY